MRELLTEMYAEHCTVAGEQRADAKDRFGMSLLPWFVEFG